MVRALPDGPFLCGVDFSEGSRHALVEAFTLATRLNRPLVVVSAIDPLLAEAARSRYGDERMMSDGQRDLSAFVDDALPTGAQVSLVVAVGHGGDALMHEADRRHAAMIVVGTRGLGRAKRLLFGSTTLRVLRATTRPVLAVPPRARDGARVSRVLCGVDFSDASMAAARCGVELGQALGARVTLVHAVAPITMHATWDALVMASTEERLNAAESRLVEIGRSIGSTETVARVGDVADILVEEAADGGPALIVLGLGGRDGHRPGTHAYRVLTETSAPVLAVPVPSHA
jgi:nucleotide-binding universal stress UspA family protein